MFEGLTTPITDQVIQELVMEQGKKVSEGEKTTLEDAVDEITRKVELYVSGKPAHIRRRQWEEFFFVLPGFWGDLFTSFPF